jgi:23S rRNA (guanosine2251-2'-O)-methyltransferase
MRAISQMRIKNRIIVLHNIRSAHNVGSIFRTAEGAGVKKIYLSSSTPAPINRFGCRNEKIAKTALGAEYLIPWEKYKSISSLFNKIRKHGYKIIGVEQSEGAVDYRKFKEPFLTVFVFGNEVCGLSKQILSLCDAVVDIKMRGQKESLNVSVCVGIILF